jgi:O-antigen ligase
MSVSLGQGFLGLALVTSFFVRLESYPICQLLVISGIFWGYEFFILFLHFIQSDFSIAYLKMGLQAENKDFFLFLACITVLKVQPKDLRLVRRAFLILAIVLTVTGLISVFSEYRLAWMISKLYRTMTTWGKHHFYGSVGPVSLYLPIGLMNTHLTFGGLLLFVYPAVFFHFLEAWIEKRKKTLIFLWMFFTLVLSFVFLLNNARSALLGTFISILFGLWLWFRRGNRIPFRIPWKSGILALVLVGITSSLLYKTSEPFRLVVAPLLGSEKHTDSGRTFIWDSSFQLIQKSPIVGIGPGNYPKKIEEARKERSLEFPELAFFYETTQRGHAHNDYFHLLTIFGFFQLVLYLLLAFYIFREITESKIPFVELSWTFGLIGFFFSGMLQCYFQDDEVVILFWYLVGYLVQSNRVAEKLES